MLCARLRINILWFRNRRVTPLSSCEGEARCSLRLCLVHLKLCGLYYVIPTIMPAKLEYVSVCVFMCVCVFFLRNKRRKGRKESENVCVRIIYGGECVDVIYCVGAQWATELGK